MNDALLSLLLAFPFPAGWDASLERRPGEPVAACAAGVPDSTEERFFGALQRRLGPQVPSLWLDDCGSASMARARREGAEFLLALSPEALALWRVDPGLWAAEPTRPVLVHATPMERPRARLAWARPRRERVLAEPALALAACRGSLYAVHRDQLQRLSDGQRIDLRPLRPGVRVRAGVARASCADEGLVIAHADYARSGVVDLGAFAWRDFSNGLRWAEAEPGWLVARNQSGTNRFAPDVAIRDRNRSRSERWRPWVDAAGMGPGFVWVDTEGRLHRGEDVLPTRVGRGLLVAHGDPPRILASSPSAEEDGILVLDETGRLEDRIPLPGAIRDLALGEDHVHVLTEIGGVSEIWRVGVEGLR